MKNLRYFHGYQKYSKKPFIYWKIKTSWTQANENKTTIEWNNFWSYADCFRARGERLTSQFSWVAAWLLVTCVRSVYLVKERCYSGGTYLSVRGRWSWERWESSELVRCGRCVSGVRWQGWKRWENSAVAQSESWEGSEWKKGGGGGAWWDGKAEKMGE